MHHEIILADDVTGAGDSGIHFAAAGKRTALLPDPSHLAGALTEHDTVVLSTESRLLPPEQAALAVREAVRLCHAAGARVVYKKIDSTLRGNPGAEIEAILQEGGFDAALVCPAMPKTGRTVVDGALFIHGTPVRESGAGRDPFNPVTGASIAQTLAGQTALPIRRVGLETVRAGKRALAEATAALVRDGCRIVVADAARDGDLATLGDLLRDARDGAAGTPRLLPVGAGGLAEAFAGPGKQYDGPVPGGRMLAVIGSLTTVSLEQIDHARRHGSFRLLELDMTKALLDPDAAVSSLVALAGGDERHLLLKNLAPPADRIDSADGERAAAVFARAARSLCAATRCPVLYVTGGGTAMAIMRALGLRQVTLERECMPGVVQSSVSCPGTGLKWLITKAGGFGAPDTLARLADGISRRGTA